MPPPAGLPQLPCFSGRCLHIVLTWTCSVHYPLPPQATLCPRSTARCTTPSLRPSTPRCVVPQTQPAEGLGRGEVLLGTLRHVISQDLRRCKSSNQFSEPMVVEQQQVALKKARKKQGRSVKLNAVRRLKQVMGYVFHKQCGSLVDVAAVSLRCESGRAGRRWNSAAGLWTNATFCSSVRVLQQQGGQEQLVVHDRVGCGRLAMAGSWVQAGLDRSAGQGMTC